MKLTIIPDDSFVSVDGDNSHQPLDLSSCGIPDEIHALQWFDTKGWIEFDDPVDPFAPKPPNEFIEYLPQWANNCVSVWEAWKPTISVSPSTLQPATVNTAYSKELFGVNAVAPYTITADGVLPDGLVIENNTLSGTPTATGNYIIAVEITDATLNTGKSSLSLAVV